MCFSKKSLDILKFYKEEQNINSIAKNFNTTYNIIRNNYFKPFYKQRYLRKTKKGHYILSTKGIIKIKKVEKQHLIEKSILKLAKEQKSNKEIINFISEKFNQDITNSSIYSKIYRKRKKNNIKRRNTNKINIPKKFSTNLAQFLGLFFSDGSYSKYDVCFYNTCQPLINKFIFLTQNIFKLENPCTRLKPSGAVEARFGSVHLSDFIFSLIGKKQKLPDKIINGSIKLKKAFLKGYFSGDGGVCLSISLESRRKKRLIFSSNIFISCKPLKIRKELAHLLTSIGYNPTIGSSSIIISRKDNLSKFYNEIKFINNSIITRNSRYWHGFEKNQLLNYIINNLRNDKKLKLMFYNNTKEEVIKYIHKRLEAIGPKRKVLPIYKINFKPKAPSNAQF